MIEPGKCGYSAGKWLGLNEYDACSYPAAETCMYAVYVYKLKLLSIYEILSLSKSRSLAENASFFLTD